MKKALLKKFLVLFTVCLILFVYTACGKADDENENVGSDTVSTDTFSEKDEESNVIDSDSQNNLVYGFNSDNNSYSVIGISAANETEIVIPSIHEEKPVTSIGDYAFFGCSGLTSVTIPDSVTSIGEGAFYDCSGLTSVTIGGSVTSIEYDAFIGCSGLASITVNSNNKYYRSENNCLIEKNSNALILGCKNSIIPDSVTSIGNSAFYNCSGLTSVTIPDSVTSIGRSAFEYCRGLTSVTIPDGVTSIGQWAFGYCSGLTSVTIPDSVTSIGEGAFCNCSGLTSVTIGGSVTSIGNNAFFGCYKLVEVINNSKLNITTKGSSNYGYIGYYALNIKNGGASEIVNQDGYLFYTYDSVNYLLGYIGNDTELILPNNYNGQEYKIYEYAFRGCSGLTSVTIPDSVTSIGEGAFRVCYKLVEVINNSKLNITKGGSDYGYVGYYALNIKNGGASEIVNQDGYLFYTYESVNYLLGYTGNDTELTLPNNYNGQEYEIYKFAFYGCIGLTNVIIPDSVTSIGEEAFYGCIGLTSVTIGNGVTSIGEWAFVGCSGLTSVTIPDSVTSIGERAFRECSGLTSITIGNGVTSIGEWAFDNNLYRRLTSVYFMGDIAGWCGITFNGGSSNPLSYAHNLYINDELVTDLVIPDTVKEIKAYAFSNYSGLTSVTIGNGVTSIGSSAFSGCSGLTSVTIPDSVTSIGSSAFRGCSGLTSIIIPDSVTSIGEWAFYNCSGLTSITIGNSVASIGSSAFSGCSGLMSVTIPESVTSIGDGAFYGCSGLTSVTIPDSVTSIGSSAFYNCSGLTSVTIGNGVTSIGYSAFYGCYKLVEVINNSNLNITKGGSDYGSIGYYALNIKKSGTSEIVNQDGYLFYTYDSVNYLLGYIGNDTELTLPNNYNGQEYKIYEYAFYGCNRLTSITIPDSVTSIGRYAFEGSSCVFTSEGVSYVDNWLVKCDKTITSATIRENTVGIADNAFNYSEVVEIIIPDSVTSIGEYAFSGCSGLTSVTIGNGVTSIGSYAFSGCSGLTSVTIPDSVTSIGNYAFTGCPIENAVISTIAISSIRNKNLKTVVITGGTSIGSLAFYNCSGLTSVTIPDSVTSIGSSAFSGCSGLTSVTIPDSVTSIGSSAFRGCSGLTSIIIPDSVTSIGEWAFYNCSGLTSVTIPDSVTSIGSSAFYGCSGLTSITIPDSVTSIGEWAFYNCSGLTSVTIGNGVTSIGSLAFSFCSGLTSVTFKNTSGWKVYGSSTATNGTSVTVTNTSQNAQYLRGAYSDYIWKRT